jgi:hypothetical protein
LGFYIFALALPLILMTIVEMAAADSAISVSSPNHPAHILTFIVYFLPGLIIARKTTDSWRRTIGVGIAYVFCSPFYYLTALRLACTLGGHCVST